VEEVQGHIGESEDEDDEEWEDIQQLPPKRN
jgi:hypothetical protein